MKILLFASMFFLAPHIYGKIYWQNNDSLRITVPIGGNTFSAGDKTGGEITNNGIENWNDPNTIFTAYVRVTKTGDIKLWLDLKVPDGKSKIQVSIAGSSKEIIAEGSDEKKYYAGEWDISDTGYIAFQLKGISKTGNNFADIANLEMEGAAINEQTAYTKTMKEIFFIGEEEARLFI